MIIKSQRSGPAQRALGHVLRTLVSFDRQYQRISWLRSPIWGPRRVYKQRRLNGHRRQSRSLSGHVAYGLGPEVVNGDAYTGWPGAAKTERISPQRTTMSWRVLTLR
jgi:hypothetical protein